MSRRFALFLLARSWANQLAISSSLLLHTESADGDVVPVWEDCDEGSVSSVRDVMEGRVHGDSGLELRFRRLPMTSEKPPDVS